MCTCISSCRGKQSSLSTFSFFITDAVQLSIFSNFYNVVFDHLNLGPCNRQFISIELRLLIDGVSRLLCPSTPKLLL